MAADRVSFHMTTFSEQWIVSNDNLEDLKIFKVQGQLSGDYDIHVDKEQADSFGLTVGQSLRVANMQFSTEL